MVDLTEAMYDSESWQPFTVLRRQETVGSNGRNTLTLTTLPAEGDVWPEGPSMINRRPDGTLPTKTLCIVTQFALRDNTKGYQADIVQWAGDKYVVDHIEDWSHVNPNFIKATCLLFATTATAPVIS